MKLTKKQQEEATKAAEQTKAMMAMPEHLKAVAKFKPIFDKLGERSLSLLLDVREACRAVIEFLKVPPTKNGRKQASLVVKSCTSDGVVNTYANRWISVLLAEKKSANIGTVTREIEPNHWADVKATADLIETHAELLGASTKANEALGIKKRGLKQKSKEAMPATPDTVYDVLPRMIADPVAFARIKEVFNAAGYAIVTNLEATMIQKATLPGTEPVARQIRKAA